MKSPGLYYAHSMSIEADACTLLVVIVDRNVVFLPIIDLVGVSIRHLVQTIEILSVGSRMRIHCWAREHHQASKRFTRAMILQ
jgi:hypothetical protein